ncbi:MAG: DNA-binding response regulator [Alphaproteobacteria bacterium]|nr:DNA-binding response regulator [Alphaproteobacteria bacterium]
MNLNKKILITENDESLRYSLMEQLEIEKEFTAIEAHTFHEVLEHLKMKTFDLFIADLKLLHANQKKFRESILMSKSKIPIICLMDTNDEISVIFEERVNLYIKKPIRFSELLREIKNQISNYEQSRDLVIKIGRYDFFPASGEIKERGFQKVIKLTEKETDIIKLLSRANGSYVSKETLLKEIWGYNSKVTTHTLETHIYRLRKKLEKNPSNALIVVTGTEGYKLIC